MIVVGVAAGLALAMGCARLLQHLLYGSSQGDLLAYLAASLLIVAVGFLACLRISEHLGHVFRSKPVTDFG